MKKRLNKLLAVVLAASLCMPMIPADSVQAADTGSVYFTETERISVSSVSDDRFSNFNEGWKFNLGDSETAQNPDFNDASWSEVTLPHDFSIFQPFTESGEAESGFLPGGTGWYRKTFTLPESFAGKSLVLNFDGVYSEAYVYVNGELVGEHHYGYTAFAFDLTNYLTCDGRTENLVAVKAVNNLPSSRWYSGSGIYRDVTLIVTDPVHVDLNGTTVTTPDIKNGDGTVSVGVKVVNSGSSDADVTVRNTVYDSAGEAVSVSSETSVSVKAGASQTANVDAYVASPKLWSIEQPNLYYVRTELVVDGDVADVYDTDFGFRWFAFDHDTGFSLNGKNVKLNGVCMHHDQGALGSAAYYDAMYRQLSIMKDMGVNAIRITHNPGDEDYVKICDELGLLVIEEFFDGWNRAKNGNYNDFARFFMQQISEDNALIGGSSEMTWAEFALKSTVKRDRNSPSVILWSLGNEISEGSGDSDLFPDIARNLIRWIGEEDATRQATLGDNQRDTGSAYVRQVNQVIKESGGVNGFNYANASQLASLHNNYDYIIASETASAVNSRGIYMSQASQGNADGKYHLTSYDMSSVGWGKTAHKSMWDTITVDYVGGQFIWTGFDYIGEPTPWNGTGTGSGGRGQVPNSSYFGIVETTGFAKDSYYLYRSQWKQDDTTLHLVTAWDSRNMLQTGGKTPVWVYSNAPVVKLYRDGKPIGTATREVHVTDAGHKYYTYTTSSEDESVCTAVQGREDTSLYAVFNVAFEDGTISARALDESGKEIEDPVGTTSITTPEEPARLIVTQEKKEIVADGSSLAYISVDVTDAEGNLDTTAVNTIQFSLIGDGEIVGVDNGDQATKDKYQQASVLESPTSAHINAYAGKALVIVRSTKDIGSFTLDISSKGLQGDSVTVNTVAEISTGAKQIVSYAMARHCYAPRGIAGITLPATVEASYSDGTSKSVPVIWNAYDMANLAKEGAFRIDGTINDGGQKIGVFITVHIYDPIGGVKVFSGYTRPNLVPALPAVAMAYYTDGREFEEYPVTWDMTNITADKFAKVGDIVTINGTVNVLGKAYPTKMVVRVAEPIASGLTNVALDRLHLVDNAAESATGTYSNRLESITDGIQTDTGNDDSRWTNWDEYKSGNHTEFIKITMDWATATTTDQINLFFFKEDKDDSALPTNVKFEYALASNWENGTITAGEWIEIGYSDPEEILLDNAPMTKAYTYKLNQNINPQAIRITFEHAEGTYIGLNEVEVISPAYTYSANTSAELKGASAGQTSVVFSAGQTEYTVNAAFISEVQFDNPENAAITLIQESSTVVKVVTLSEDGKNTKTYKLILADGPTAASRQALLDKINECKALDSKLYTATSLAALKNLAAQMERTIDTMSESQLKRNLAELVNAYASLEKVPTDVTPKPPVTTEPVLKKNDTKTVNNVQYKVLSASKKTVAAAKLKSKKATKITIPATVTINGVSCKVTEISASAFKGASSLKSITIGKNVTTIGKNAFQNCKKLNKVTFKGTAVKTIKPGAFKNTNKKITVNVPKSMKKNKKNSLKKKLTNTGMSKNVKVK